MTMLLPRDNQKMIIAQRNSGMSINQVQTGPYYDLTNLEQESRYLDYHSAHSCENDEFHEFSVEEQDIFEE